MFLGRHLISTYLETSKLVYPDQLQLLKGLLYETHLKPFPHVIHSNSDFKNLTDTILIDFSKAFGKVPHERILEKLTQPF